MLSAKLCFLKCVWGNSARQWRRQHNKGARSFQDPSQVTRMHFFLKKVDYFFSLVAVKTQRPPMLLRLFHCQNKTSSQRSDMVKFLFSVHTITEAKQSNRQEPGRWIFWPGAPWCSAATAARPFISPARSQAVHNCKLMKCLNLSNWKRDKIVSFSPWLWLSYASLRDGDESTNVKWILLYQD